MKVVKKANRAAAKYVRGQVAEFKEVTGYNLAQLANHPVALIQGQTVCTELDLRATLAGSEPLQTRPTPPTTLPPVRPPRRAQMEGNNLGQPSDHASTTPSGPTQVEDLGSDTQADDERSEQEENAYMSMTGSDTVALGRDRGEARPSLGVNAEDTTLPGNASGSQPLHPDEQLQFIHANYISLPTTAERLRQAPQVLDLITQHLKLRDVEEVLMYPGILSRDEYNEL